MICSQCNTGYSRIKQGLHFEKSFRGLCATCGTEPQHQAFFNSYAKALWAGFATLELYVLFIFVFNSIAVTIAYVIATATVHGFAYYWVKRGNTVQYASERQRRTQTRKQRVLGYIAGIATALMLFLGFTAISVSMLN